MSSKNDEKLDKSSKYIIDETTGINFLGLGTLYKTKPNPNYKPNREKQNNA